MKKPLPWIVLGASLALPGTAAAQDQAEAAAVVDGAAAEPIAAVAVSEPTAEAKPEAAPAARSSNRLIEEIVVTAQKREENIQDVPLAITAFSPEKLDAMGIQTAQDLEKVTPGLTVTNAAGFQVYFLRGIGTDAFLPGADSSVPFYLDGVALLGAQGSADTLGRVERVEVLKGPQGTLFGRNATGGAVNIITPNPTFDEVYGDVNFELGDYNQRKALVYANIPITDSLAAVVSGFYQKQDNFYTNDTGPILEPYSRGGRVKIRWNALDNLSVTLAGSIQEFANNSGLTFENTRVAPILCPTDALLNIPLCVLPQDPKADRHISADSLNGAQGTSRIASATVDWSLPAIDTKLTVSLQKLDVPFVQADFDKSNLPIINITSIKQVGEQETAELQFLSNDQTWGSDYVEWVAGLFYFHSKGGYDPIAFGVAPNLLGSLLTPMQGVSDAVADLLVALGQQPLTDVIQLYSYGILDTTALSGYAQGTFHLGEAFDLTLGLRYQDEKRDLKGARTTFPTANGEIGVIPLSGSSDVDELHAKQWSPRVALQWRPIENDPTQIYLSWSRAFKSPTYNTVNVLGGLTTTIAAITRGQTPLLPEIKPLKEEQVDTYELGTKMVLLDGSMQVESAVFYTKQKDLLTGFVAVLSGGIVSYVNAPEAEIKGAELSGLWSPMPDLNPGLAITAAGTYLDAKYTDYPEGKGFDEVTGIAFGNGGTEPLPARDFKGNRIVRTPKWNYNLGINQSLNLNDDNTIELGVDTAYASSFFFLPQNSDFYKRNAYQMFNARVSYFYNPWQVQLTAYVNNFTDETYNEVVFVDDFGRNQVLNAPRTYGMRFKKEF